MFERLRGRRVLVTGHTGFKGSWLALWLATIGAEVTGYALDPSTEPSNFELIRAGELLAADHRGDIADTERVAAIIAEVHPHVVFHLAAQPLVRAALAEPAGTFATNVMGTVSVLEGVRRAGRPAAVVCITSDKCYDNQEWAWGYRETDALGGKEAYGSSKAAAELVVASYRAWYFPPERLADHGIQVASARAGNVIGGGDWSADRIVPDIVRAVSSDRPLRLRAPDAIRPWQHVLTPLSGYLALADRMLGEPSPALCSAWNFGPESSAMNSVRTVVERSLARWGRGTWEPAEDPLGRHESTLLHLNIDKARLELQWSPAWDFDQSVAHTVAWYEAFLDNPDTDVRRACLNDIDAYERAMR